MAENRITRDELVEKKVFDIGIDYANSIEPAVNANKEWLNSFGPIKKAAIEYAQLEKNFNSTKTRAGYAKILKQEQDLTEQATIALKEQQRAEKNLITTKERAKVASEGTSKALQYERENLRELNRLSKLDAIIRKTQIGSYKRIEAELSKNIIKWKSLSEAERNNSKEGIKLTKTIDKQDKALKKLDAQLGRHQRHVGNYQRAYKGLSSTLSSLTGALGLAGGIYGFFQIAGRVYKDVKAIDAVNKSLKQVTETTYEYNTAKKFLIELSDEAGVELLGLSKAYTKFLAAAKTTNLTNKETEDIFRQTAKAGAVLGLSTDEINGSFTALEQILSKGKVQAEEIRGQLGERLPGAFQILAKSMDLTTQELSKQLELGNVISEDVLPGFARELAKTYSLDNINKVETLAAAENRLSNNWTSFVMSLESGEGVLSKTIMGVFSLGAGILDLITPTKSLVDEIKKEQLELNVLVNNITDVNVSNDERERLIENLKREYPQFLKFLKEEKTDNESLSSALREINDLYVKRIALQTQQEKIEEALKESGEKLYEQAEVQVKVNQKLAEINRDVLSSSINLTNKSYKERISLVVDALKKDAEYSSNKRTGTVTAINDEAKALSELSKLGGAEIVTTNKRKEADKELSEEQQKMKALEEALGITIDQINKLFEINTNKKKKNAEVTQKELNKVLNDEFELRKFLLETRIKYEDDIANNEKQAFDNRFAALEKRGKLEIELSRLIAEKKLKETKNLSNEQIQFLLDSETLTKDKLKTLTDEQLLIYSEYWVERKDITKKNADENNALEIQQIETTANIAASIREKTLQEALQKENEAFNSREGIYKNEIDAVELREKRIAEIKKQYAIQALKDQIVAIEALLATSELSAEQRAKYEEQLATYKKEISDIETENLKDSENQKLEFIKESNERIKELQRELASAFKEIANNILQNRINNIDQEIEANNEKYDALLEDESLSERQREAIENQRDAREDQLQEEKKKRQKEAFRITQAIALAEIGINLAKTISAIQLAASLIAATIPPPAGITLAASYTGVQIPLAVGVAAAQTAAVLSNTPAYEEGTENHPGGRALVAEKRPEVIEEPGKNPYIVDKPTILDLPSKTKVIPSLDEYDRIVRASMLSSVDISNRKLNDFQAKQNFNFNDERMVNEMKLTRKAFEKNKTKVVVNQQKPIDMPYEVFKFKNFNWR